MLDQNWDDLARKLEATGNFKVLRRLKPRRVLQPRNGAEVRNGLFVDVETTGLDHQLDEAIQIALVPFRFGRDGTVFDIDTPYEGKQAPSASLNFQSGPVNGLTAGELAGRSFDVSQIDRLVLSADLVVAHNAAFDRPFAEKVSRSFALRPWGCSMVDIDWTAAGFESRKLSHLAARSGFFYPEHDAVFDCLASIEVLSSPLCNGMMPMAQILRAATVRSTRVYAERAPFATTDLLKKRGYRWVTRPTRAVAAWWKDTPEHASAQEIEFLSKRVFGREVSPPSIPISAYERFSERSHLQ